jgi:hypothetical protein
MSVGRWLRPLGCLLAALCAASAAAQDANYWALQYGPVAQLLGGQVIGSERSLSATFYNPGGLALEEGATFLLSTESVQLETLSSGNPALDLFDTSSTRFGTAPTLVAGTLPRAWFGEGTRMAWSFLTRQELKSRLGQRVADPFALEPAGGSSATELYLDNWVNESWAGLTLSRRLSDDLGVGATLYGVYRGQRSRSELNVLAVDSEQAALSLLGVTDFAYSHFRLLAKLGVSWERDDLRLGLSVTTPSAGLLGWGEAAYTRSLIGVDADNNGLPDPPIVEARTVNDLDASYRSSWAIGSGLAWRRRGTRWHLSAEWFAPVDRFDVLKVPPDGGRDLLFSQQLKSVFNVGLGVEHELGNETVVYGAALTDFTASVGDPEINVAVSNWNLYHLSAGVKFAAAGNRFTLGATYSFGNRARPIPFDLPLGSLPGDLLAEGLDVSYRRVVLLLGFLFGDSSR